LILATSLSLSEGLLLCTRDTEFAHYSVALNVSASQEQEEKYQRDAYCSLDIRGTAKGVYTIINIESSAKIFPEEILSVSRIRKSSFLLSVLT
jgi:hypothetical protein